MPRLRAVILEKLTERWVTVRELASTIDEWRWTTVRLELNAMADEGLISRRIDTDNPAKWIGYYCKPHGTPAQKELVHADG